MERQASVDVPAVAERAVDVTLQEPELVVLVLILALVAGLLVRRYLRKSPGDRFVGALRVKNQISVLMHPNPDPDAMASALGVAALASEAGTDAVLCYSGRIRHPENRAFETVLDCDFERIERASDLPGGAVVLVDHNEPRGFPGAERIDPYAVVDHHPGHGEGRAFTDVRSDRGSCASIVTEYIRDRDWSKRESGTRALTSRLATALLYGIHSDTTSFTRGCTESEFEAAAYLFPAADSNALERIANPRVDEETLEVKARAIAHRDIEGSFLVSDVGEVSNLDALPAAAEELIRLEGVSVAVVVGKRDGRLHVSGRSRDDRVHMGKALEAALGTVGDASAGGHARMGGGQAAIPTTPGDPEGQAAVVDRLFAAMNGEL